MRGERRRVLILVTLAEVGGAQTYVATLVSALTPRYDVTVAAYGDGPLPEAVRSAGASYVPLRHVRRALSPRDILGLIELLQLMKRVQPDLLHANSSKAGVLGRLAAFLMRVPVIVFTVHGWAFKATSGPASTVYLWADRLMSLVTTATICVSQTELEAGRRARTCNPDKTVVIRNGVGADDGRPSPLAGNPPVVMSVGRLKEPKTFVTLAQAFALLEPGSFRGLIVGDGPDRAAVEAAAGSAAVTLLGERHDVPKLLRSADVFVLSSASEGLPMSVLEAMAAGLPVVASRVGGVPELLGDTGLLVPANDAQALAAALRELLADSTRRRRLGAAARERVLREFGLETALASHVDLYERLLAPVP